MSDNEPRVGEPVQEPSGVDDVVGSANEGLSDAEAARTGGAAGDVPVSAPASPAEPAAAPERAAETANVQDSADTADKQEAVASAERPEPVAPAETVVEKPAENVAAEKAVEPDPWESPEASSLAYTPEYSSPETVASTAGSAPVAEREPAAVPGIAAAAAAPAASYPAQQPIFVQAPEAPRPRGNRGAAGAIGLDAAASFAVLYLTVWFATDFLARKASFDGILDWLGHALTTWTLWVPVVIFFLAFWLLGAIINRGRWGLWVIFGLLVGFIAYGGYLLGVVCQAPFWMVTATEARRLVETHLFSPLAVASFIIARELTIWFGAWVAARGRRVTLQNLEAQREYERTLEAGPQLHVP
jgi:hypothetical protein